MDSKMYSNGTKLSVTAKEAPSIPQNPKPSDSDGQLLLELEQKRKQLDDEVARFQAQKEKEFRDFEAELRTSRKRKVNTIQPQKGSGGLLGVKLPVRSSSSSALNLLAGHVTNKQPSINNAFKKQNPPSSQPKSLSKTGPAVSQPVVSLDKLNINGENAAPNAGRPRTPPTPTLLSKTLARSSSTSSLGVSPPKSNRPSPSSKSVNKPKSSQLSRNEDKSQASLTGLFTPSYLHLLDSNSDRPYQTSSALISPSTEDEAATAPSSYKSSTVNDALPLSSSSYPPHTTASPGGHSHPSKRSYTAPTVSPSRKPSALRTASGGALTRKPKHVTFRLADSAIVEPSSSYEEGPSPELRDEKQKSKSGAWSPLRVTKSSQLQRTLSPDEEDEEAGVKPGMGMGDVIQRLNDFTVSEAAKNGEELVLEVEENEEDDDSEDDDDDDDEPMELGSRHLDYVEDDTDKDLEIDYHEHEDEPQTNQEAILKTEDDDDDSDEEEEDDDDDDEIGYFSPKAKHMSTMSPLPRGNSPLTPDRPVHWAELSSSDKDRLLFEARRHSDDSDDMRQRLNKQLASPTFDETGFSGEFKYSLDGGSGVGFFELDEELASIEAGNAQPFLLEVDSEETEVASGDNSNNVSIDGLGVSTTTTGKTIANNEKRWSSESASKFGVGSVPIDIVRPSLSVSSSWVGTFGH